MVKRLLLIPLFFLCACESVRTVYDESGKPIKQQESQGGEKDFSSYMEDKFNSSFSEKKNDQGVPQTFSNKVSSYQSKLDDSKRLDKEYLTRSYGESARQTPGSMSFAGASGKAYEADKAYPGLMGASISKDLHPAFASSSRGIYGTGDSYAGDRSRSSMEGRDSSIGGSYYTKESFYSRDMTSGYFETRKHRTPPPRVITRDEYYRKTIEETRTLLGRDKPESSD